MDASNPRVSRMPDAKEFISRSRTSVSDAGVFADQPGQILDYLEAVLAHPAWEGTPRRSAFLRFVVRETLAGQGARLKGTTIALEVFGRSSGGDHQGDAIVRVEARRLRRDLDCYYAGPGRADPIRIAIPKGGYTPVFDILSAEPVACLPQNCAQRPVEHPQPTVLVQPFTALGQEPLLPDLAEGLTHEVISALMQFPGFRLHSLEDSFAVRLAPPEQGYLVRAIVQLSAERLKVCARLARVKDGQIVWSRTFTRPFTARDLICVQSEIATDIAEALGAPATGLREGLISRIARAGAPSVDSYMAVLAAQTYRRTNLLESYADTRIALEHAVRCDPGYADAWAYLALLRLDGVRHAQDVPKSTDPYAPALEAAHRALALDPENIPGHTALMLALQYNGKIEAARAAGEQALALNPHDPEALIAVGYFRVAVLNDPAGLDLVEQALARSVSPPPRYFRTLTVGKLLRKEYAAALDAATRAMADGSSFSAALKVVALVCLGRQSCAEAALEQMMERRNPLTPDPVAFMKTYWVHPAIVSVVADGLRRAGWVPAMMTQPQ